MSESPPNAIWILHLVSIWVISMAIIPAGHGDKDACSRLCGEFMDDDDESTVDSGLRERSGSWQPTLTGRSSFRPSPQISGPSYSSPSYSSPSYSPSYSSPSYSSPSYSSPRWSPPASSSSWSPSPSPSYNSSPRWSPPSSSSSFRPSPQISGPTYSSPRWSPPSSSSSWRPISSPSSSPSWSPPASSPRWSPPASSPRWSPPTNTAFRPSPLLSVSGGSLTTGPGPNQYVPPTSWRPISSPYTSGSPNWVSSTYSSPGSLTDSFGGHANSGSNNRPNRYEVPPLAPWQSGHEADKYPRHFGMGYNPRIKAMDRANYEDYLRTHDCSVKYGRGYCGRRPEEISAEAAKYIADEHRRRLLARREGLPKSQWLPGWIQDPPVILPPHLKPKPSNKPSGTCTSLLCPSGTSSPSKPHVRPTPAPSKPSGSCTSLLCPLHPSSSSTPNGRPSRGNSVGSAVRNALKGLFGR